MYRSYTPLCTNTAKVLGAAIVGYLKGESLYRILLVNQARGYAGGNDLFYLNMSNFRANQDNETSILDISLHPEAVVITAAFILN